MTFDPRVFWGALFSAPFALGALTSLALALAAHAVGIALGLALAVLAEGAAWRRWLVGIYTWLFRGAPTLLQLLFVWNALPQLIPALRSTWFSPFLAALLALSLNEAAYQAEISRAALLAVDEGQIQAAQALGLRAAPIFFLIRLPQAIRIGLPPTVNEFITLLKTTSLASVISLQELLAVTSREISSTFHFTELYAGALGYYLAIVSVLMLGQSWVERRMRTGQVRGSHARRAA